MVAQKSLLVLTSADKTLSSSSACRPSLLPSFFSFSLTFVLYLVFLRSLSAGGQTGWYLPELANPYYIFKDSFKLTLASPKGGKAPLDEGSAKAFAEDPDSAKFLKDTEALALVDNTVKLSSVSEKGESSSF